MQNGKFYCSVCKRLTHHNVLGEKSVSADGDAEFWWNQKYRIVQCCGCDHVSFNMESVDESMVRYDIDGNEELYSEYTSFPVAEGDVRPIEYTWNFPSTIYKIYSETLTAFNNKCYALAAAGFRMIVEAICKDKEIKFKNLEAQINGLRKQGIISEADRNRLHSVRFMGNDSVHVEKTPTKEDLLLVLEIINGILSNLYVIEDKIKDRLEKPIQNFKDFEALLLEGLSSREVGEVDILRNLLPENRRLIKEDIASFESQLKQNIQEGKFSKLELCPLPSEGRKQQYKIVE